ARTIKWQSGIGSITCQSCQFTGKWTTQDPAFALLHVARAPRPIEVMKRGQTLLHICSRPGFFRACDHDPDLSRIGVGEGSGLLGWRLEVMNESDFVGGNAALDQFALDLAVDAVTVEPFLFGLDGVTALLFQFDLFN